MKKKSYVVSVLLTVIFGPLGIFYTSGIGGLVLTAITLLLALAHPLAVVLFYPVIILLGIGGVYGHNSEAEERAALERKQEEERMIRLAEAIRGGADIKELVREKP